MHMNYFSNNRKKIVYIVSSLSRSGPTNQLLDVVKGMDTNLFDIYILALSPEVPDSRLDDFVSLGITFHCFNMTRFDWFFKGNGQVLTYIKNIRPDIIHSHGVRADIINAHIKYKNAKKVATVHNYPHSDYMMQYGVIKGWLMANAQIYAFKKLDCLVSVSNAVRSNLQDRCGINKDNIILINNGVDKEYPDKDRGYVRHLINIPNGGKIWVYAASFVSRKNHDLLLNAWIKLDKTDHLILLGDGPLFDSLRDKFICNENIHFLGQVTGVINYLNCADYYVAPSYAEGFPVAVLEAMAIGKPVLLSNIEPHKEIFEYTLPSDNVGVLFEHDVESLVRGVNALKNMDYTVLSENSNKIASLHFNSSLMSKKYQELYFL
ncbi:glycosyltransferase [Aeromonas sp. 75A]|uniref:glycosyltransferase n=1 Tax=unclassified Aeromonas TaxID=257493 RepID=UPI002E7B4D0D|nr:glycosyltransferase [Aeromonas sp. 43P]MEE1953896.1 glycosyltransferase [Aeromonas sp. 43P]